jgi:CheY-like chemotaxis protein
MSALPPHALAKILVIDDDKGDLSSLGFELATCGYQNLTLCESAIDAMSLIEGGARFDLVITDIVMPKMDGLELVGALHKRGDPVRSSVLAVSRASRWANFDVRPAATEMGVDLVLFKPYRTEQLMDAVSTLLKARAA